MFLGFMRDAMRFASRRNASFRRPPWNSVQFADIELDSLQQTSPARRIWKNTPLPCLTLQRFF